MNPLALASSSKRALDSLMTLGVKLFITPFGSHTKGALISSPAPSST